MIGAQSAQRVELTGSQWRECFRRVLEPGIPAFSGDVHVSVVRHVREVVALENDSTLFQVERDGVDGWEARVSALKVCDKFSRMTAFAEYRARVEAALADLSSSGLDGVPESIVDPVRYALAGEGKRLRPIFAQLVHEGCGGRADIIPLAIAVEIIHTYSLVHDDLPCMDDDDVRRGRPTLHKQFSEREAILAGAALIPIAARTVFRAGKKLGYDDGKCSAICRVLLRGAGAEGMIGGQLRDLAAEGATLTLEEMESLHSAKTGELMLASARLGAISADASPETLKAVEKYARALGLAFQIMDDVLDATQTSATIGKTAGRDAALGKSTYVSLLGVEQARRRAEELVREGMEALSERGLLTSKLTKVANFILARNS